MSFYVKCPIVLKCLQPTKTAAVRFVRTYFEQRAMSDPCPLMSDWQIHYSLNVLCAQVAHTELKAT